VGPVRARSLDATLILATLARLRDRIEERFPGSGLGRVAHELLEVGNALPAVTAYLARPNWAIRIGVAVTLIALFAVLLALVMAVELPTGIEGFAGALQAVESLINDLVFLGIAIYFLANVEQRLKRKKAL